MLTEFATEEFANRFARRAAELTGKAAYYWYDRQNEVYKVECAEQVA